MAAFGTRRADRVRGALGAVAVPLLLGWALVVGLAVRGGGPAPEVAKVFGIAPTPPPPRPRPKAKLTPRPKVSTRPEGAASPPNLRAKATELVAPPPLIVQTPPIVAAEVPGIGNQSWSGAAEVRGPGTGSGGIGNGTGSGGSGDGDGDGGAETPPRWRSGQLRDSDYPEAAAEAGVSGTVHVRYVVQASGRVTECEVTRSSGNRDLDETTCRLIERRFRYRPSLDGAGRPVPSVIVESHSWEHQLEPAASD